MTNLASRQKLHVTQSLPIQIISKLMNICNLNPKDDISKDLRKSCIIQVNKNVNENSFFIENFSCQ